MGYILMAIGGAFLIGCVAVWLSNPKPRRGHEVRKPWPGGDK